MSTNQHKHVKKFTFKSSLFRNKRLFDLFEAN